MRSRKSPLASAVIWYGVVLLFAAFLWRVSPMNDASLWESNAEQTQQRVDTLLNDLKSPDRETRASAVEGFGIMGTSARSAVPPLMELLKDKDCDVRSAAASALGQMGDSAAPAAPRLLALLKDKNSGVGYEAVMALESIARTIEKTYQTMDAAQLTQTLIFWKDAANTISRIDGKYWGEPAELFEISQLHIDNLAHDLRAAQAGNVAPGSSR